MGDATGEAVGTGLRVAFDRRLKLEFHGATVSSDAGLLAFRELDDALGLTQLAADLFHDARTGKNGRHTLLAQFRQAVFGPVVARYRDQDLRRLLRGDAAFALPDVYEYLEAQGFQYTIRLPANHVLQAQIAHLLTRPVRRPPHDVRRFYASFRYRAQSWSRSRRVIAKVEWHPGELYPRVGFIVTNLHRSAKRSSPSTTGAARRNSTSRRASTR